MRDGRLGAEQAIDRPLEVRADPEWKLPLGDRDVVERRRMKMGPDEARDRGVIPSGGVLPAHPPEDDREGSPPPEDHPEKHPTRDG